MLVVALTAANTRAQQSATQSPQAASVQNDPSQPAKPVSYRANERISDPEIIRRIDAAVYERSNALARYTVKEQYDIYRNGETSPSAQMTIKTVYSYSIGKEYTVTAQSGSQLMRSVVFDKILEAERDMAKSSNREKVWVTSANYEMRPEPGTIDLNGRQCVIVDLKSRRKSPHLFNGKVWVDASDFTVLRLEGIPAQSPSVFAGQTQVVRDYARIDGFSMATHADVRSHSFLLGDTLMKIAYTDYQIERGKPAAWVPSH